jgi:hypothetical protein
MMVSPEDSSHTYDYDGYFKILPNLFDWSKDPLRLKNGQKVPDNFEYNSSANSEWMTQAQLKQWLAANSSLIGKI